MDAERNIQAIVDWVKAQRTDGVREIWWLASVGNGFHRIEKLQS